MTSVTLFRRTNILLAILFVLFGIYLLQGILVCLTCCFNVKTDCPDSVPAAMENLQDRAAHIHKVLLSLPNHTLVIMRYLFAFLNQ